jgi:hypothetical protein
LIPIWAAAWQSIFPSWPPPSTPTTVFDKPCTGGPPPSLQHSHSPQASSAHAQLQSRHKSRCDGKGRTLPPTLAVVGVRRAASRLVPEPRTVARRRRGPGASSTCGAGRRRQRRRRRWRQGTGAEEPSVHAPWRCGLGRVDERRS